MINEIKFRDEHPILRGLHLNFSKEDGTPYKTIIIAGENGCGKTTIFKDLATLFRGELFYVSERNFRKVTFQYVKYCIPAEGEHKECVAEPFLNKQNTRIDNSTNETGYLLNFSITLTENNKAISCKNTKYDIRNYGFAYIPLQAVFQAQKVSHVGNSDLDKNNRIDIISDSNLKQLLVNIFAIDAMNLYSEYEHLFYNSNKLPSRPEAEIKIERRVFKQFFYRISRFKNAFNNSFEEDSKLKFQNYKIVNGAYDVRFQKNEYNISIDELSSGEKQIVFRGGILLKNKLKMNGGLVLVDEPELSMHPRWQKRVLKYYQDLLSADKVDKNGNLVKNEKGWIEKEQIAQLIVATHSPYIIEEALKDKEDTLVIVLKEEDGKLNPKYLTDPDFITKTSAEVNYIAFGIPEPEYVQQLYEIGKRDKKQSKWDEEIHQYISKNKNDSDKDRYLKESSLGNTKYHTLPTYIRNSISHWDAERNYTDDNVRGSIDLLREIIEEEKGEEEHL